MKRISLSTIGLLLILMLPGLTWAQLNETIDRERSYETATGVVFNDANRNGLHDAGEKGIAGVRVSDGRAITTTDSDGRYKLPITGDAIIFVIKPRNWMTQVDSNNIPRFYYIYKPNGSPKMKYPGVSPTGPLPESIDFPLYPRKEPNRFDTIFLGDTQTYNQQQIYYLAHDVIEELVGTDAAFSAALGDITGDDLSLFLALTSVIGQIGIPCYSVIGNHDRNYDAPDDESADDTFERNFGPSYYSYDYGPVHFVVLDDPFTTGGTRYKARLGAKQLVFIRNDLARVPHDQLVVLMMHIPIFEIEDRDELFGILEKHPNTFSISAHYHNQQHHFLTSEEGWNGDEPHHHLVNVTSCGSWWAGAPDEMGIPHSTMSDGIPNGYSIVTFDGTKYSIRYKAARRPADYQMNVYAPDEIKADDAEKTEVYANVFGGSERSKVEMRLGEDGPWFPMLQTKDPDPFYVQIKKAEEGPNPPAGDKVPNPMDTMHIWKAKLPKDPPAGTHLIHVRTTDMFGHTYTGRRVIIIN